MKTLSLIKASIITGCLAFPVGVWAAGQTEHIISQKKRAYAPGAITIKAGESLKIVNDDIFLHHAFIDSDVMEFDSGSMEEGDTINVRFDMPGSYQVKCAIHPKMNLDVTVK